MIWFFPVTSTPGCWSYFSHSHTSSSYVFCTIRDGRPHRWVPNLETSGTWQNFQSLLPVSQFGIIYSHVTTMPHNEWLTVRCTKSLPFYFGSLFISLKLKHLTKLGYNDTHTIREYCVPKNCSTSAKQRRTASKKGQQGQQAILIARLSNNLVMIVASAINGLNSTCWTTKKQIFWWKRNKLKFLKV